ncbi:unnamed protein product [Fusarium equiseti]|uniref:C2H2-type domain-containing protein n=1 Tax=Fusarium equiseti TaxID=61235 RepID=A0A8J2IUZ4_FUSEQ|nr:unnamed protein product [Fusarium equiseti]
MEPPAKRIKLEPDYEPNLSALPAVDISADSDCKEDLSFEARFAYNMRSLRLTFEDAQSLENYNCETHHMCRQCFQRFATAEEPFMHSGIHGTLSEVIDDAIQRVVSLSKGAISETLATATLHDVIARTVGTMPHTQAARGAIPTVVEAQVDAPSVVNAPVCIKAEARATPPTEPTKNLAEMQPEPSTPPVVAPPVQIKKEQTKQRPQGNEKKPDLQCLHCSWTIDDEDMSKHHKDSCNSNKQRTWCDLCKKQYNYTSYW